MEPRIARVLVVDDDPDMVALIIQRLDEEGHICTGVTSAREAVRVCLQERFDCMLLDAQLGTAAGLAVAERLAGSPMRPFEIVIVTGHSKDNFEVPLRRALIDGYVQKPLDVDALAERVMRTFHPRDRRYKSLGSSRGS